MTLRPTLALLVVLGCCSGNDPVAPPSKRDAATALPLKPAAGRVDSAKGAVTLEHEGVARALRGPTDFFTGDAVETGEAGSAVLVFKDGRIVELGPDGRFEVSEEGGGMKLSVSRGLVLTRLPATRDGGLDGLISLTISTPFGLTKLEATEAQVKVGAQDVDLEVRLGTMEFVSKTGDAQTLVAGQRAHVTRELPTISMMVTSAAGRVEVKKSDSTRFTVFNQKKTSTLVPGDTVRVVDGRLTLSPEESATRLTLLRGSEAVLASVVRGEGAEETTLDLKKGELQVLAPDRKQRTRVDIGGGLGLTSDLGALYSVKRGANGVVELATVVGDLLVMREGAADVTVPGGATAKVTQQDIQVVAAAPEAVQLPTRMGLKVFHPGEPRMSLTWEGTEGVKAWRVVVANDAAFTSVVMDGAVHQPFLNLPMPARGVVFWRVYEGETETGHGSATFAAEKLTDLSRVKNLVPDGPDTTTILFQDKPPMVTLTWAREEGAAKYVARVYREGDLKKVVAERTTGETSAVLSESTLTEGKYRWSVTSLDAKGTEVKGGRLNKLSMEYDNAVTQLVLKSPKNGESVGAEARVSGVAPVGARVFVNGRAVELDAQARFDAPARPNGGRVIVRMVSGSSEAWTIRKVRR